MIIPLAIATDGLLHGVLNTATRGYFVTGVVQTISTGGGGSSKRRTIHAKSVDELQNLIRDDEELITIIVAATKIGIF